MRKPVLAQLSREAHKVSLKYTHALGSFGFVHHFQRFLKPFDQSKPNFTWNLHMKEEPTFISMVQIT